MSIPEVEVVLAEAARRHGLTVADIKHWKDTFLLAAENALWSRPKDEEALREEQVKKRERKVGQLVVQRASRGRRSGCALFQVGSSKDCARPNATIGVPSAVLARNDSELTRGFGG